jgi:Na+-transporting NADH:ubiquinone oxidoreductase subunit NqrB
MLLNDPRTDQILFLSLFLLLGLATRDWTLQPGIVGVAIATCLTMQWVMGLVLQPVRQGVQENGQESPTQSTIDRNRSDERKSLLDALVNGFQPFFSALITALGLSLLLRVDHYTTMMLAGAVAISSKFLLQINGKHIFNPANVGIIAALTLTRDAWVSPGQWGESGWYVLLFLATGGIVLRRVGRWDTTVAFLGAYAGLEAVRNLWLGWTWDVWAHRLMSGSLLLFALFMITDPRTIPNARVGRLLWAIAIACLTFILRNHFFISTGMIWALFALAPLSILLDAIWVAPQFAWIRGEAQRAAGQPDPVKQLATVPPS